jgi:hypothetical protein
MKRLLLVLILILTSALVTMAQTPSSADQNQITEVTLERTPCFGYCPFYKVTLKSDGTIIYEGKKFVQMMGTYKGEVYNFERLAQLISSVNYFNLNDNYRAGVSDLPSAITSVVQNGKRKTIVDYGGAGPIELWGVEMAVDGMLKNAKLKKMKGR